MEQFSYDLEISVRYCFISQWMKRSKHELFVFSTKKTLIWRRHCSIGQSCCSMTSKRSIDWFLESSRAWSFFTRYERSLNQPKATRVCIPSISQSNRSIFVRLLFLFCSRVFISRLFKNRFILSFQGPIASFAIQQGDFCTTIRYDTIRHDTLFDVDITLSYQLVYRKSTTLIIFLKFKIQKQTKKIIVQRFKIKN